MTIFSVAATRLIDNICTQAMKDSEEDDTSLTTTVGNMVGSILGKQVRNLVLSEEKRRIVGELKKELTTLQLNDNDNDTLKIFQDLISKYRDEVVLATESPRFTGSDKPVRGTTEIWLANLRDSLVDTKNALEKLRFTEESNPESPRAQFHYLIGLYYAKKLFRARQSQEEKPAFLTAQDNLVKIICRKYRSELKEIGALFESDEGSEAHSLMVYLHVRSIVFLLELKHNELIKDHKEASRLYSSLLEATELRKKLESLSSLDDPTETMSQASSFSRPSTSKSRAFNTKHKDLSQLPPHVRRDYGGHDSASTQSTDFEEEQDPSTPPTHRSFKAPSNANSGQPPSKNPVASEGEMHPESPRQEQLPALGPKNSDAKQEKVGATNDPNSPIEAQVKPPSLEENITNELPTNSVPAEAQMKIEVTAAEVSALQKEQERDVEQIKHGTGSATSTTKEETVRESVTLDLAPPAEQPIQEGPVEISAALPAVAKEESKEEIIDTAPASKQNFEGSTSTMLQQLAGGADSKNDIVTESQATKPNPVPPLTKAQKRQKKKEEEAALAARSEEQVGSEHPAFTK